MLNLLRFPRTVLLATAALLALSAAGVSIASAPVLPAGTETASSTSELAGYQLPTLALDEASAE